MSNSDSKCEKELCGLSNKTDKQDATPECTDNQANWWDSWLSTAKSKSSEVYTMVKKDLDEIGTIMKDEASNVLNSTSTVLGKTLKLDEPESPANMMKKSFSSFIGQMSTALNPEPDDDDTEIILASGNTTTSVSYMKELEALQRVDATFIVPADSTEFKAWRATFERPGAPIISNGTASRRLEKYPILKEQYQKLVPDAVNHNDFWERYLFRVALLQDNMAAPKKTDDPVLSHLHSNSQEPTAIVSSSVSPDTETSTWDEGEFTSDVELTEEQQLKLLEDYEKEIIVKKTTGNNKSKSDICSNQLVEDHFDRSKDDASSHSDESWEKDFEFDDKSIKK